MNKFIAYLKDDSGQTSTEYILLLAVVALIVFKFKETASTKLDALTQGIFEGTTNNILDQLNNPPQ